MSFSISQMVVDPSEKVVAVNWSYSNDDGTLSNQWKLLEPYGDVALADVTEDVAVAWLEEQLPNTAEDFDNQIAQAKAQVEYQASLVAYEKAAEGRFTPVEPEAEAPVTADL